MSTGIVLEWPPIWRDLLAPCAPRAPQILRFQGGETSSFVLSDGTPQSRGFIELDVALPAELRRFPIKGRFVTLRFVSSSPRVRSLVIPSTCAEVKNTGYLMTIGSAIDVFDGGRLRRRRQRIIAVGFISEIPPRAEKREAGRTKGEEFSDWLLSSRLNPLADAINIPIMMSDEPPREGRESQGVRAASKCPMKGG